MKKRLFIAIEIELNEENQKFVKNLKKIFNKDKIKWVDFENFHITLKFLGETDENLIPSINNILKKITKNHSKFKLNLKGLGIFKNFSNPRVLWIGLENSEILKNIFNEIENHLEDLGFKKEKRDFNPHITLGRIKKINNIRQLTKLIIDKCDKKFQEVEVNEIILMESKLSKEGAKYYKLESFPLFQNP